MPLPGLRRPDPAILARPGRFERLAEGPATESRLYHAAATRLAFAGWPVCALDTTASAPDEVAAIVTDRILTVLADRSADGS